MWLAIAVLATDVADPSAVFRLMRSLPSLHFRMTSIRRSVIHSGLKPAPNADPSIYRYFPLESAAAAIWLTRYIRFKGNNVLEWTQRA
jgi:hypothetical protein